MSGAVTLDNLRDHARPLLIFAPTPDDPQLQIQLRTLSEHASGVTERDVAVVALPFHAPAPTSLTMSSEEADAVRRRFQVSPGDFIVILIGKDGGEKLRSGKPLRWEEIEDTIDAMPMRQDEMRRKGSPSRA